MKTSILIAALLLLFVTEFSQGCTGDGYRRRKKRSADPTAPIVDEKLAKFFHECHDLVTAATGILQLPSAVDYVLRDSEWYKNISDRVCDGHRDIADCWQFALKFLLDTNSIFFKPAATCICKWAKHCTVVGNIGRKKRQVGNAQHLVFLNGKLYNSRRSAVSQCIQSRSQNYVKKYPSLKKYDSTSVTTLLNDHYTYCRTIANVTYEKRNLFNQHYQNLVCPKTGPRASWRTDITTLYKVATRKDGPIWAASRRCDGYSLTPTCNFGSWTQWFNHDNPDGIGDYEDLSTIRIRYPGKVCDSPSAVDGRLATGQHWTASGQVLTVSSANGLTCANARQFRGNNCKDYKVRFCCKPKNCQDLFPLYC